MTRRRNNERTLLRALVRFGNPIQETPRQISHRQRIRLQTAWADRKWVLAIIGAMASADRS